MAHAEAAGQVAECRWTITSLHALQNSQYVLFNIDGHTQNTSRLSGSAVTKCAANFSGSARS